MRDFHLGSPINTRRSRPARPQRSQGGSPPTPPFPLSRKSRHLTRHPPALKPFPASIRDLSLPNKTRIGGGVACLPPHHGGRGVRPPGKITGGGVGLEPPSPKMRTGQWCTNDRQLIYKKMPAVRGFSPATQKRVAAGRGPA